MFGNGLTLFAQQSVGPVWADPYTFGMAMMSTLIFGGIGIILAIVAFKLFDKLTPGKLDEEILQKQNIAAAILAGAFIIGICIVVAAAIHG
jgi:putative membrane protein